MNTVRTLRAAILTIVCTIIASCAAREVRTAPKIDGRYIYEATAAKRWYAASVAFNLCEVRGTDKENVKAIEENSWILLEKRVAEEISRDHYNSLIAELHADLVRLDQACMKSASKKTFDGQPPYTPEQKAKDVTEAILRALKTSQDLLRRASEPAPAPPKK